MQVKKFPDHHVDTLPPFDARHVQKKKKRIHALHAWPASALFRAFIDNAALTKLSPSFSLADPNQC